MCAREETEAVMHRALYNQRREPNLNFFGLFDDHGAKEQEEEAVVVLQAEGGDLVGERCECSHSLCGLCVWHVHLLLKSNKLGEGNDGVLVAMD
jgi:hypothetical protein